MGMTAMLQQNAKTVEESGDTPANIAATTTDSEVALALDELFFSRTEMRGRLQAGNAVFQRVSEYSWAEMIDQPHNIVRHPDMPLAAFADLWATVSAGRKWHGYVKNLRKDGTYYWVYATAVPNVRNGAICGYTSVRRKPSRAKIAEVSALYAQMLKQP